MRGVWRCSAAVFSGRPDPVWEVQPDAAAALAAIWDALPRTTDAMPQAPALGYRGSTLSAPSGIVWRAYGGVVESSDDDHRERRADPERRFERSVLATAPAGLLPPGIPAER